MKDKENSVAHNSMQSHDGIGSGELLFRGEIDERCIDERFQWR